MKTISWPRTRARQKWLGQILRRQVTPFIRFVIYMLFLLFFDNEYFCVFFVLGLHNPYSRLFQNHFRKAQKTFQLFNIGKIGS